MSKKIYFILILALSLTATADEKLEQRLNKLEKLMSKFQKELEAKDKTIKDLKTQLETKKATKVATPAHGQPGHVCETSNVFSKWDKAHAGHKHADTEKTIAEKIGFDEVNLGVSLNVAAGAGDLRDNELEEFQGGGHSPQRRGVNLQELNLSFSGSIENAFDLVSSVAFTEDEVELEEAFIRTNALPYDLTAKVGFFFTEFGLNNPTHVHDWKFIDQPIINSRLFGGEGQRGAGAQLNWEAPLPWQSEFIVSFQDTANEYAPSFKGEAHSHGEEEGHGDEHGEEFEEGVAGRPFEEIEDENNNFAYLLRWTNQFAINENLRAHIGASGLFGENHTGGDTVIYGLDWVIEWNRDGYDRPFLTWQTEIMKREYDADAFDFVSDDDPAENFNLGNEKIEDWGLYSQIIHSINNKWAVGFRYQYVSGSGDNFEGEDREGRDESLDRADRQRFSPMVSYSPSTNSTITLQYNHDQTDVDEHSEGNMLWLGFEIGLGGYHNH